MADPTQLEVLIEIHERLVDLPLRLANVLSMQGGASGAPVRGPGGQFTSQQGPPGTSGKPIGKLDSLTNLGRTIGGPLGQLAAQIQHFQAIGKAFDDVMKAFGPQAKAPIPKPNIPFAQPVVPPKFNAPVQPTSPKQATWPGGKQLSAPTSPTPPKPPAPPQFKHAPKQYKPPQFGELGNQPGAPSFKQIRDLNLPPLTHPPPLPPGSPGTARRTARILPPIPPGETKVEGGAKIETELGESMDALTEAVKELTSKMDKLEIEDDEADAALKSGKAAGGGGKYAEEAVRRGASGSVAEGGNDANFAHKLGNVFGKAEMAEALAALL